MTTTPPRRPTASQTHLRALWRRLMGPHPVRSHSLWLMVLQDDVPVPQLMEITGAHEPNPAMRSSFSTMLRLIADDEQAPLRFAFLVSRPGLSTPTSTDRAWASELYAVAREAGVACEVVHVSGGGPARPIPPDDLEPLATSA